MELNAFDKAAAQRGIFLEQLRKPGNAGFVQSFVEQVPDQSFGFLKLKNCVGMTHLIFVGKVHRILRLGPIELRAHASEGSASGNFDLAKKTGGNFRVI